MAGGRRRVEGDVEVGGGDGAAGAKGCDLGEGVDAGVGASGALGEDGFSGDVLEGIGESSLDGGVVRAGPASRGRRCRRR